MYLSGTEVAYLGKAHLGKAHLDLVKLWMRRPIVLLPTQLLLDRQERGDTLQDSQDATGCCSHECSRSR